MITEFPADTASGVLSCRGSCAVAASGALLIRCTPQPWSKGRTGWVWSLGCLEESGIVEAHFEHLLAGEDDHDSSPGMNTRRGSDSCGIPATNQTPAPAKSTRSATGTSTEYAGPAVLPSTRLLGPICSRSQWQAAPRIIDPRSGAHGLRTSTCGPNLVSASDRRAAENVAQERYRDPDGRPEDVPRMVGQQRAQRPGQGQDRTPAESQRD